MRFVLIDRILEVEGSRCRLSGTQTLKGQTPRLTAVKNLSLAEEYLSDHFPGFPVMPGVLMLEALTQAGAWLIRDMEDFATASSSSSRPRRSSTAVSSNPAASSSSGRADELDHHDSVFKGVGMIDGQEMVKGRFTLTRYNLRDRDPALHATDATIVAGLRDLYATLRKGSVGARAIARRPVRLRGHPTTV